MSIWLRAGENGALGPPDATAASDAFVASRMDDFKAYGSATIAVWVINPVRIQIGPVAVRTLDLSMDIYRVARCRSP